jgi:tight adherence protein B
VLAAAGTVVAAFVAAGPGLAVLVVGAAVAAQAAVPRLLRRRAARAAAADVPLALEAAARSLRAGASLPTALADAAGSAGPLVAAALSEVVAASARGQPLVDALDDRRADVSGVPGLALALTALAVAAETGGAQAAALDGVALTLRQRLAADAEAASLGAQARMSGWVIAAAPVGFAALTSAADRRTAAFLLQTPTGLALLAAGLALDAAGALWMRRLTQVAGV